MAKQETEFKLPNYLKLAKDVMWMDTVGDNCSNITLYNIHNEFIGRGCISDNDWEQYTNNEFVESKEIPHDVNHNDSYQTGSYGYRPLEKDTSYFCTIDIPKEKLGNIIYAYKTGVLISYDPDAEKKEIAEKKIQKNFGYKADGDIIFVGKNKAMFDKLNNAGHDDLITFIKHAPINSRQNLLDLYEYELDGFNRINRPRATILDAIRARLNEFGPGMSAITIERNK